MIKIKTNYDYKNDRLRLKKYQHAHSCTYEHLAVITMMINETAKMSGMSRKKILELLKEDNIIKEVNNE